MTSKWTCVHFGLGHVFPSSFLYLTLSLSSLISFSSTFVASQVRPGSAGSTSFPGPNFSPSPLQAHRSLTKSFASLIAFSDAEILLHLDFQILGLLLPTPEHRGSGASLTSVSLTVLTARFPHSCPSASPSLSLRLPFPADLLRYQDLPADKHLLCFKGRDNERNSSHPVFL